MGQGVMAAVPQGGCLAPSCQPSVLGKLLPTQGNRPGPIRRQGPCQEEEARDHCALWRPRGTTAPSVPGWTQHLLWEASASGLSPIREMPPVLVPHCQHLLVRCPPTPTPPSSKATGPLLPTQWATSLGFLCWQQQIPQETCSTRQGLLRPRI